MCVGFDGSAFSISLLVLLGLEVVTHRSLADEVASAGHAVVLAKACLVLINGLVLQLLGVLRQHVRKHNLVYIASRGTAFGLPGFSVLFVPGRVCTPALGTSGHLC